MSKKPASEGTTIPGNQPAEQTVKKHEDKVTPLEKTDGALKDPELARKAAEKAKVDAGVAEQNAKIAAMAKPDQEALNQRVREDAPSPVPQPASNPFGGSSEGPTVQHIEQRRAPIVPTASIAPAPHVVSQGVTVDDPPQGILTTSGPIGEDQRGRGTTGEVVVETIKPGDADGRQPGNPNDFIDLPPGVSAATPVARLGMTSVGDAPMTIADLEREEERLKNMSPLQRVEGIPLSVPEGGAIVRGQSVGFDGPADALSRNAAAPPTITPQTSAEIEAGRAAVASRNAEIERNKQLQRDDEARRMRSGAAPDAGDLSYRGPKE